MRVINSPFIAPVPLEPLPEPGLWATLGLGLNKIFSRQSCIGLIFAVLRPIVRYSTNCATALAGVVVQALAAPDGEKTKINNL